MVRRLKRIVVMAALIAVKGYTQAPPVSIDPHEDPAVQNSEIGKKSAGQEVVVPKDPAGPKTSKPPVSKKTKKSAAARAGEARPVEPEEAILGTWNLVIDKSKFNPGPPPKGEVRTYLKTRNGIEATVATTQPDGSERTISYPWQVDGKEHAVAGSELLNTIRLERLDSLTAEATLRHGDKILASERRTLAPDGKTMTIVIKDLTSEDRPIDVIAIYEKK